MWNVTKLFWNNFFQRFLFVSNSSFDLYLLAAHPHPHPHPHPRHSHNVTNSCIGYTCSELKCAWNFPGDIPDCPGKSCNWSGGSKSSGCTGDDGDDGTSNDDGTSSGNVTSSVNETSTDDVTNNDDNADYQDGDINDDSVDDAYYTKIEDFDVGNCTSFSNYWLWDLALTCDSSYNLTDCECTSAAILMSKALLTCPDGTDEAPYCPDNCDICNTCLSLLGCSQTKPPGSPLRGKFSMSSFAYILAAIAGVLLGVIAVMVHQKKDTEKPLEENLVDGAMPPAGDGDGNVWLAPVSD